MAPFCNQLVTALWLVTTFLACPVNSVRLLPAAQRSAANEVLLSIVNHHQHHHNNFNQTGTDNNVSKRHRRLVKVDVPTPASPDDHLVTSLPLLAEGTLPTKHWAGLLPASPNADKYLFYWLFAPDLSQNSDLQEADIPLVIWLNGGPGCSSMDGLFLENGPLRFEKRESDGTFQLVAAQHSWHKVPAYMVYIDQPVGTGLSFTTSHKYPRNDREVNIDFYYFLQSFLKTHSDKFVREQRLNRGLYFSGESHAGHYIPSMMAFILDQNPNAAVNNQIYVPLSGAAIGNGWVDPFHQYAAAEAAYGHGIIGRAQMTALAKKEKECQDLLNKKRYSSAVCFNLLDDIVGQSYGSKSNFKVSQYDIRQVESRRGARTFPPGHKTVETYLGGTGSAAGITSATMNAALAALHATPSRQAGQIYQECTNPPYDALSHQDGLGVVNEVVKVLDHQEGEDKVRLLFFNGVTDLICNHVGNEVLLEKLPWKNTEAYVQAPRSAWKSKLQHGDKISGYIKEFENLLYLKVMDSGHMVPMDVPDVALDMMRLFLYGGANAFQYSPQSLHRAVDDNDSCPTCQVCPTNITNYQLDSLNDAAEAGSSNSNGAGNTNLFVGLGLGLGIVVVAMVWNRNSRNSGHSTAATYDLEMRGGTYYDDPVIDGNGTTENASSNGKDSKLSKGRHAHN